MSLQLYNTLTRRVEPFTALAPPRVTLYTCGPTVWNFAHIGNFRTFLFEDLLRRHLEGSGFEVYHIMNLTDVDDRVIKAAAAAGKRLAELTDPFAQAFFEDRDFLRIKPAHAYPRATRYMPAMIALIERLLERGVAYRGDDGSVYLSIAKFPTYGRLSQLERRQLKVGARVASDEDDKENPSDFALWKAVDEVDEQVGAAWDAPFGRGRPGWHLECSAMSLAEIGTRFNVQTLDIHCGAIDLIFPHHENEIAQSEAATGQTFARCWLHGAFLNVKGTKMSKRYGNFLTARDLQEQGVDAGTFRTLVYQTHYRQPLDYTDTALEAAREGSLRLGRFRERLENSGGQGRTGADGVGRLTELATQLETAVRAALDNDLDSPQALARVFDLVSAANAELDRGAGGKGAAAALGVFDRVIQLFDVLPGARKVDPELARWAEERVASRERARKSKDFKEADRIRAELKSRGVEIEDTPSGTKWRVV